MVISDGSSLTCAQAHQLLKRWDCLTGHQPSMAERDDLRSAVRTVAHHSDYQILGICAESLSLGVQALLAYAAALGYSPSPAHLPELDGPVYLKFNPKSGLLYGDRYVGPHRGVLVSCQSAYADGLNEMYGHLPLDLFAQEDRS
ncbi:DUF1824 family protein [Leptolyngbya sp. AN02str]|uniref:DUF1824 family protein n=1 Tax=Leptolyngbya sp. AN02str TaxID=3423363 RepID=UPI003D314505